jgi:hypothetical protein
MNKNSRWNQAELGQTAVLFALMLIGLILFVGWRWMGGTCLTRGGLRRTRRMRRH